MRLIDADRLKAAIHTDFSEHFTLYHDTDQIALFDMVMDDIDEMPTAFDKEEVIRKLEEAGQECNEANDICGAEAIDYAIGVVEEGGVE